MNAYLAGIITHWILMIAITVGAYFEAGWVTALGLFIVFLKSELNGFAIQALAEDYVDRLAEKFRLE